MGFIRGLRDAVRGDPGGLARAAAIAAGLLTTTAGYASERAAILRRPPRVADPGAAGRLRVLMVTPRNPLGQGGVERHVIEVSRRVAAAGAEVEVLCAEPGGRSVQSERRDDVLIRSVRAWPANRDYYFAPRLWREIGSERWNVVHVQSYHTLVAPLAMLRALSLGIPYVVTFHGGGHSSAIRNRLRRLQRLALRPLLARAERLVAVARFEIDLYSRELRLPREKFVLIPNGTDLEFDASRIAHAGGGAARVRDDRAARALQGPSPGDRGASARARAAARREPAGRREGALSRTSSGARRRSSASATGSSSRAFPADDREAMAALLGRVSLVVLLSDFETHPLVALEAAAAGRRLLVADGSGLGELADNGLARSVATRRERRGRRRGDRGRPGPPAGAARAAADDLGRVRRRAARSLPVGPPDVEQTSRRFRFS